MRAKGANGVGRFSVEFEVANYGDIIRAMDGTLKPEQVRRRMVSGLVDPGATKLVLPQAVVKALRQIHALLNAEQRLQLAYLIRTGALTV